MTIVKASPDDVAELNALINSAYRGDSSRKGWTTEANLLDGIRIDEATLKEYISDPDAEILTGRNDQGQMVACMYLKRNREHLYLGMLTVSPELQGQGTGKLLLRAAEAKAAETGSSKIIMTVISARHELIDWYKRHGYTDTGDRHPFGNNKTFGDPKTNLEFMVLEKNL